MTKVSKRWTEREFAGLDLGDGRLVNAGQNPPEFDGVRVLLRVRETQADWWKLDDYLGIDPGE